MFNLFPRQYPKPKRSVVALVLGIFLVGCSPGEPPIDGWEVASRGLYSASLSDDAKYLVVGSVMHGGSLWDLSSKERLYNWNHTKKGFSNLSSVDISADGRFAVTAEGSTLVLWSIIDGAPSGFWSAPGEIVDVALSSDGHYALLGLANYSAVYFDIKNGGVVRTLFHKGRVTSVDLSLDDRYALTGSEDNDAIIWDVESGEQLQVHHHDRPVQLVALSPDGSRAFSFAKYDGALIWNSETGETVFELPMTISERQFGAEYSGAKFSSRDPALILLGNNHRGVELWNYTQKVKKGSWEAQKKEVTQLASGAAILDLAFDGSAGGFFAITSDGMVQQFK